MRKLSTVAPFIFGGFFTQGFAQEGPDLGVVATPEQETAWDISIEPDGQGLPVGSGTVAAGQRVYEAKCMACHGEGGTGGLNDRLVGGLGTIDDDVPIKTLGSFWPYATTIFDYVRRAMPYTQPQSLTNDETYSVTAYLLFMNGVIEETAVINAETLPQVRMPNRDTFISAFP